MASSFPKFSLDVNNIVITATAWQRYSSDAVFVSLWRE